MKRIMMNFELENSDRDNKEKMRLIMKQNLEQKFTLHTSLRRQ